MTRTAVSVLTVSALFACTPLAAARSMFTVGSDLGGTGGLWSTVRGPCVGWLLLVTAAQ